MGGAERLPIGEMGTVPHEGLGKVVPGSLHYICDFGLKWLQNRFT
jgi:hypothetical protein